jgi:hypothetical protein
MFEVDYLLPRTFMSALELKHLKTVILTGKIPAEVVLANLIFFVRKTKPRYSSDYATSDEVVNCFISSPELKAQGELLVSKGDAPAPIIRRPSSCVNNHLLL